MTQPRIALLQGFSTAIFHQLDGRGRFQHDQRKHQPVTLIRFIFLKLGNKKRPAATALIVCLGPCSESMAVAQ